MIVWDVAAEYKMLFYSLFIGLSLGILWDILRIPRLALERLLGSRVISYVSAFIIDLAYFILAALLLAIFVFHASFGVVRGFVLFGTVCGLFAFRMSVGRLTYFLSDRIINAIRAVLVFITKKILMPVAARLLGIIIYINNHTVGRILNVIVQSYRQKKCERAARELIRLCQNLPQLVMEGKNAADTNEYNRKARTPFRVHISDNHLCEHSDKVQQPQRRARRA